MCDEQTERDLDQMNRRDFGLATGGLALATVLPAGAATMPVVEREVMVKTPDGMADAYFVAPVKGKHAAVLVWPDIFGLRPAMRQMYKRLAAENGYAALVVNPFYRSGKAPVTPPGAPFDDAFRAKIGPMRALLTPEAVERDAKAFVAFLDAQKNVDSKRKIGTSGYCMGGALVLRTAAAVPERVGAGASFHGGSLATDAPNSPHLLIPKMKASFLIAAADNDDKNDPEDKNRLRAAFDAAKLAAEIEVYEGAMHGWCPSDGRAYNAVQAERAWQRMLVLFGKALVV
jgi:carboxymethylenebutenolidase